MLIPSTYAIALTLMIVSAICWGSWANTQKLAGAKWRFELFYVDYSVGALVCAVVICFTLGSFEQNDITFLDSLIGISLRKLGWALLAGFIFNIANILLVAAVSVAGLSVAFPVGMGLAAAIGAVWSYSIDPTGNASMLWAGLAFLLLGIAVTARAYHLMAHVRRSQEATGAASQPAAHEGASQKRVRKTGKTRNSSGKGIILSLACGIPMGCFYPMLAIARESDLGISPYASLFFFSIGMTFGAMLLIPFLMNFPVEGPPLELKRYFEGSRGKHVLGVLGGLLWMTGLACQVLASSVPRNQNVGPAIGSALGLGATVLAALWGVFVWKEFADTGARVRMQVVLMFVLLVVALALISIAPLY